MQRRTKYVVAGTAAAIALAAGTGIAIAGGEDEDEGPDTPITGPDLERASTAALEHTGGGRVTGTEVDDEESYYEVEVTLDDGSQVDVQLDEQFQVVGSESDESDESDESEDG